MIKKDELDVLIVIPHFLSNNITASPAY